MNHLSIDERSVQMKVSCFKKSALAMMLLVVLLCSFFVNVSASERSETTVTPRWVSIYSINLNMAFDEYSGVVTAVATKKSGASLIEGTLYLYKLVNGEWVYMNEWYKSKAIGTLGVSGDFISESGVTYKGVFTVTAYTNGVPETETVEYTKTCP